MYIYTEEDNRVFAAQIAAADATREKDKIIAELQNKLKTAETEAVKEFVKRLKKRFMFCGMHSNGEINAIIKEVADEMRA